MIRIQNLTKHFGGVAAVQDATFSLAEGKITGLIGPNGAGKTTVFNLISGIIPAERGEIWLGKQDITPAPSHQRAMAGMARTFQQVRLFRNLSVADNIALARTQGDDQFLTGLLRGGQGIEAGEIQTFLKLVGLDVPFDRLASDLSYGQSKLLELARALAFPHKLLMLDEPVAGINPKLREDLKIILRRLRDERHETILIIEHDMDFIMGLADHVIVMDQGTVLAEGTPLEIRKNHNVLEAYLGIA